MRVLIVTNNNNPRATGAAGMLADHLRVVGFAPQMPVADAQACGRAELAVSAAEIGEPLLAVALGGDGTMLKAFHALAGAQTPLLGVKFGRLGFLSGAVPEEMIDAVDAALAGDVRLERRTTVAAQIIMDGRTVGRYAAMNEIVIARASSARLVAMRVDVDGQTVCRLRGDGLVVSTATGSTAYALSAGGPIVAPDYAGLLVVPVAPHSLQSRPLLTGPSDVVEIALDDPARADAHVVVDGDLMPSRQPMDRIIVKRGDHDVTLVKLRGRDFYQTVAEEFFGG